MGSFFVFDANNVMKITWAVYFIIGRDETQALGLLEIESAYLGEFIDG